MFESLYDWLTSPAVALVYFAVILPVSLCLAPKGSLDVATNVQFDFNAYRIQQFDLQTVPLGSRSHSVHFEATAATSGRAVLRRCLVLSWRDLIDHSPADAFDRSLGSVVILLPKELSQLAAADVEKLAAVEADLVSRAYDYPVYLAPATPELSSMLRQLTGTNDALKGSALSAVIDGVTANAYSLVSHVPTPAPKVDEPLYNIIGKLSSFDRSDKGSTVAIVAHYDTFGASPALAYGADSNGSGVAALLELLRIFSRFYSSAKTRPAKDLLFVLTTAGKLNYQGARHWIDQLYEQTDGSPHIEAVICLDALAGGVGLNMHVSKMPSEGSTMARLHQRLSAAAKRHFNGSGSAAGGVTLVPKKINLADPMLAWEHERFSIRRLPAFTLSHFGKDEHADPRRKSITDTIDGVSAKHLSAHTSIIADALIAHLYDLPDTLANVAETSSSSASVDGSALAGWLRLLARTPRSAQSLAESGLKHQVVADLVAVVDAHSTNMHTQPIAVDKKEPEFALYPVYAVSMAAHRVKPAVFDLLLATIIGAYLAAIYAAVLNVERVIMFVQSRVKTGLSTAQHNGKLHH